MKEVARLQLRGDVAAQWNAALMFLSLALHALAACKFGFRRLLHLEEAACRLNHTIEAH
jgi:hypothetical protein